MSQGEVLKLVEASDGLTVRDLIERLKLCRSTILTNIRALEKGGFVWVERSKRTGTSFPPLKVHKK